MTSIENAFFRRFLVIQVLLVALTASISAHSSAAHAAERGKLFIQLFPPEDYGGPPEVRDIVQDASGAIYAACDAGVLQFDGAVWRTIPHPDQLPIHSLAIDNHGTIFVGCDGDIGSLRADETGTYRFVSLLEKVPSPHRTFQRVQRTIVSPDGVFFLAAHHLFRWSDDGRSGQLHVWTARREQDGYTGQFTCAELVDGQLYVHQSRVGLAVLRDDSMEVVAGAAQFRDLILKSILPFDDSHLLLVTETDGLLLYSDGQARPFDSPSSKFARRHSPTGCTRLPGGLFALSTQKRAVVLFDQSGNILHLIDTRSGATRNAVGRVFVDKANGLWIPLAHGLARTKVDSPFQYFDLNLGLLGNVRAVVRHNDDLFVGTTQGLFALKSTSKPGRLAWLERLAGGRCRDLLVVQDQVLVTMNRRLFVIDDGQLAPVSDRKYVGLVAGRDETSIFVGGNQIDEYSFGAEGWTKRRTIASGLNRLVDIVDTSDGNLWLHTIDANGKALVQRVPLGKHDESGRPKTYGRQHGLEYSGRYFLFVWHGQLFVSTPNGLFQFDALQDRFNTVAPARLADGRTSFRWASNPQVDSRDRVWFMTDSNQVARFDWTNGVPSLEFPFQRAQVSSITAVVPEIGGTAIWATTSDERLIRYDESLDHDVVPSISPRISRLSSPRRRTVFGGVLAPSDGSPQLPYVEDTLRIEYGFPRFDTHTHEFQSRLVGLNNKWSEWTRASYQDFAALREGHYRFELRARDGLGESETAAFEFNVLPPWNRTWWAYGMYAGVLLVSVSGLVRWRVRDSHRQMRRLEEQVEERRRAEAALAERLRFEELIAGLSAEFIDVAAADVGPLVDRSLKAIVEFTDVDRIGVFLFSEDMQSVQRAYEQYAAGASAPPHYLQSGQWHRLDALEMRWVWDVSKRGHGFAHSTLSDFPDEADEDRRLFEQRGTKSLLQAPMSVAESVLRFVYLECVREERHWSEDFITQFGLIAQILANAVHRQRAEEERKEQQSVLAHVSRLSTMGEMVAGIAHEITQPLHAISNFAVASTKVLETDPSERQKSVLQWIQKISAEVDRSGEIIRRLRHFTANAPGNPRMLDLNSVVQESLGIVAAELRSEEVTVHTEFHRTLPQVCCDRVQIQQVLVNMFRNAMDAMRDTPVADRRIRIFTQRVDGELQVEVRDHGCGFSTEESTKLFDTFYTTKAEGMGIGLAISRTIIENHNGRVWATRNEQGSSFTIALPTAAVAQ